MDYKIDYKRYTNKFRNFEDEVVDLDEIYEQFEALEDKLEDGDLILLTKECYKDLQESAFYNNIAVRNQRNEALKEFAEKIKMRFYYNFDELIPSIMSDEIDKILKEDYGIRD